MQPRGCATIMPHQTPVVYHPGQLAGVQILGVLFFRSGYSLKDCHAIDRRGPLHPYKSHAPPETQRATYRQQQSRRNVISPGAHLRPLIIIAWMAARMSMVPPAATHPHSAGADPLLPCRHRPRQAGADSGWRDLEPGGTGGARHHSRPLGGGGDGLHQPDHGFLPLSPSGT